MPTISLRLTEQEHADLKRWAHDSHRSIQKEAIYRLFTESEYDRAVTDYMKQQESQPREKIAVLSDDTAAASEDVLAERDGLAGRSSPASERFSVPPTTPRSASTDLDWLARRAGKKK